MGEFSIVDGVKRCQSQRTGGGCWILCDVCLKFYGCEEHNENPARMGLL